MKRNLRWVREGGREETGRLKLLPSWRESREGGRWSMGWLKFKPRERERREGGRLSIGWLNLQEVLRTKWVREEGRWSRVILGRIA